MNSLFNSFNLYGGGAIPFILFAVGLFFIIKGGDLFVDAAIWTAEKLRMPKFLIGSTIVSLATTLPELLVSCMAVAQGDYAISIGNAVGSVTANTGLILAIIALFTSNSINIKEFGIKAILVVLSAFVIFIFTIHNTFSIFPSIILMIIFIFYMGFTIKLSKDNSSIYNDKNKQKKDKLETFKNIYLFILGSLLIILGARLMIDNAKTIALNMGIKEEIIAITIVAIGTSLPELVTTITSIIKKEGELGIGNIIGANIIDLVLILPICSFISKGNLIINSQAKYLDIPICLLISIIGVIPTLFNKRLKFMQGVFLLFTYCLYLLLAIKIFN